jgi:hypothetical protein
MRHLISGADCAIAGEATVANAAPLAETFKKSRRFIQASPWLRPFPVYLQLLLGGSVFARGPQEGSGERALAWKLICENATRARLD